MAELEATYSVVLKAGLPPREFELLKECGGLITSSSQLEPLIHISCTVIDSTDSAFLKMEAFKIGDTETHPLWIPYHYVLLISGAEQVRRIGFTAEI